MKTTQATKTPSIGFKRFIHKLFSRSQSQFKHHPLSTYINITALSSYPNHPNKKHAKLPSFSQKVYAIKDSLQVITVELAQTILKSSILHFSIKELLKLLRTGTLLSFYSMLPLAMGIGFSKSAVKYFVKSRKTEIQALKLKALANTAVLRVNNNNIKEHAGHIKNLSKDASTTLFQELLLSFFAFTFEIYLYYLLLGFHAFVLTLSISVLCFVIQAKLGDEINTQSGQVRNLEKELSQPVENNPKQTLLKRAINLINTKSVLNQWRLISKTVTDMLNNFFSFGLILITATLIFSGQYEIAILVIQAQAAIEAFNSFTAYFELPAKWGALQISTNDTSQLWKENEVNNKMRYIFASPKQEKQLIPHVTLRILLYLVLSMGITGLPLITQHLPMIGSLVLTYFSPAGILAISISSYYLLHRATAQLKVEDLNWKFIGVPVLITLTVSSGYLGFILYQNLVLSEVLSCINPMFILAIASLLSVDYACCDSVFYTAHILMTFLSQQTLEVLRIPVNALYHTGLINTHLPEDDMIKIDLDQTSILSEAPTVSPAA
ncbi:hypothetical protein OAT84_02920 [Gammaproteobacteria bacterium]|nr:hypothetical protein [Gammaproteobacteria bacterium]